MTGKFRVYSLPIVLLLISGNVTIQAQGFKRALTGSKMETVLKRKLAPYVVIKNKRIKIIAVAQGNTTQEVPEILKTKLVTDVQKDTGFVVDEYNPETILKFTVTAFDVEFRQGTYQSGNSTLPYTMVNGNVEVSYQAIEAGTNAPVDSENLIEVFKQDFPPVSSQNTSRFGGWIPNPWGDRPSSIPPSKSEVYNLLLNSVVKQMAVRAAPVEERFSVLLPLGKLDQLSRIAQTQSWQKVLEGAETMKPLEKPEDDAYRVYLIGLANEALAYTQTNNEAVRDFLFKARKAYDDARMKKSGEKEFIEPWTRVDKAVTQYDKIKRQIEEYQKYLASKAAPAPAPNNAGAVPGQPVVQPEVAKTPDKGASSSSEPEVWTNQTVIQLWQSKVSERILLQAIAEATQVKFDTKSPKGLSQLSEAKIPDSVIGAMMEKMSGKKSPPPKPGPKATDPKPKPVVRRPKPKQ